MSNIKISRITAIGSFGIGTTLFLAYLATNAHLLLPIGFYYLLIAIILNITILLNLLISAFLYTDEYIAYLKAIGFMLLNIPVTLLYLFILRLL